MRRLWWLWLMALPAAAQPRWWMDEPVRLVQTNLRETDAALDAAKLVDRIAAFPANALLFGMGGIVAYYPTTAAFHYASPHLPPGRDLFGEVLREAHRRGIRVVGRFDLSKTQKPVFDAHPEWFFRRENGESVVYNGLYSTCINGGYYRGHAPEILAEALDRYEVDGLFFNMFGNPSSDYSGNYVGLCHCESCRTRFRARFGRALPDAADADYNRFMADAKNEVAARIGELIHSRRPRAAFLTYIQDHVDGIMSESNTALDRPLPLWPYSASDNVDRARTSQPSKMAFNLCMAFVDIPYRFAAVPPAEVQARLYQSMAHGAGPAFAMLGTPDQEDRSAMAAARPVFEWHARNAGLYVGQENAARVLLLGAGAKQAEYRGWFRLLTEQHVPFAVSDNLGGLEKEPAAYDLVIAPEGSATAALEGWLRRGGRLLVTGAKRPELAALPRAVRYWNVTRSAYFRVRDRALVPSLRDTGVLFVDGDYLELDAAGPLTLIPPALFGPPEKVWTDKVETSKSGLVFAAEGRVAYIPWAVGALYYRHSSPAHAGLMADVVDRLLPSGRQLRTGAHPLVEITVMRQGARTLVHFVNLSGHSQTAWFPPVEMRDIDVRLAGRFSHARCIGLGRALPVKRSGTYGGFVLPRLGAYDVVVLE